MAQACPQVWDPTNVGPVVDWVDGTFICEGSEGITECITSNPGTIGYIDAGYGQLADLQEVYLENKAGSRLTSRISMAKDGLAAAANVQGLLPSDATMDFSYVNLIDKV